MGNLRRCGQGPQGPRRQPVGDVCHVLLVVDLPAGLGGLPQNAVKQALCLKHFREEGAGPCRHVCGGST